MRNALKWLKFILLAVSAVFILTLFSCNLTYLSIPNTVTIDGVTYRNGFYGSLWAKNLTFDGEYIKEGSHKFRRVNWEKFDWVHSAIGGTSSGILYCSESQWDEAFAYYSDYNNFTYYCSIGAQYVDTSSNIITIPDIDPEKFNALLDFAKKNEYNPFSSNKSTQTRTLPIPNKIKSPVLVFFSESKDGFFTSFKGNKFHVVDGKLLLVFYYDYGHGEYEELVAVDVPDDIGQYFIELVAKLTE